MGSLSGTRTVRPTVVGRSCPQGSRFPNPTSMVLHRRRGRSPTSCPPFSGRGAAVVNWGTPVSQSGEADLRKANHGLRHFRWHHLGRRRRGGGDCIGRPAGNVADGASAVRGVVGHMSGRRSRTSRCVVRDRGGQQADHGVRTIRYPHSARFRRWCCRVAMVLQWVMDRRLCVRAGDQGR